MSQKVGQPQQTHASVRTAISSAGRPTIYVFIKRKRCNNLLIYSPTRSDPIQSRLLRLVVQTNTETSRISLYTGTRSNSSQCRLLLILSLSCSSSSFMWYCFQFHIMVISCTSPLVWHFVHAATIES